MNRPARDAEGGPTARRCYGRMYSLPKPGYDLETMRAVAVAYRHERWAG